MSLPVLYGFGGYKESGKDASVDVLESRFGFVRVGMSDPIDAAARSFNPIIEFSAGRPVRYVEYRDVVCAGDYAKAKEHHEVRTFLRNLGGFGRSVDERVWVDESRSHIEGLLSRGQSAALTGVRFPKELDIIRDLGGVLVWVSRPGVEDASDTHVTETSVSPEDFDVVVVNDGTLEDLYEKMARLHLG